MAQVIDIPQPKTRWWLESERATCFTNDTNEAFCPVRLWLEYSSRRGQHKPSDPAFVLHGKALGRVYMVKRTTALMICVGMSFNDHMGAPMDVRAASWRSGAVCSAVSAGVSVPYIMIMGRWSSRAWENYVQQAPVDLQQVAQSLYNSNLYPARSVSGFDVHRLLGSTMDRAVSFGVKPAITHSETGL